jgi:carbamoyltransferase
MTAYILSFHATHNAGAALLHGGEIVAAASEERFNRRKHYAALPYESIRYCLDEADIEPADVDQIVIPSDVVTAGARLLLNWDGYDAENVSRGTRPMGKTSKKWLAERIRSWKHDSAMPSYARLVEFPPDITLRTVSHHESHAASAYYTCGHDDALVVTSDGLGDDISLTVWHGRDGQLHERYRVGKEGSLGYFYGVVTQALGWWVGDGEGKTMGLSSYGDAPSDLVAALRAYCPEFRDGRIERPTPIDYPSVWRQLDTFHPNFEEAAEVEALLADHDRADLADAAQRLLEEQLLDVVGHWLDETGAPNLAVAGGVFLNVAVNRKLLAAFDLDDFHAFPAAGDDGLPVGAALSAYHADHDEAPRHLEHPNLGSQLTDEEICRVLDGRKLEYRQSDSIAEAVADLLLDGQIVAWCQDRMEFGPRALGNRSILLDPQLEDGQERVNAEIKFRESWRPFAPSILERAIDEYLVDPFPDTFMITSYAVREEKQDEIPAVTHVDGTTRPQVVKATAAPKYHELIDTFDRRGGVPIVLNTSFNLSGEPIVRSAEDAVATFYNCGLDALAIGDYLLQKDRTGTSQPGRTGQRTAT